MTGVLEGLRELACRLELITRRCQPRLLRGSSRHPRVLSDAAGWAGRPVGRMGGPAALARDRPRAMTFV